MDPIRVNNLPQAEQLFGVKLYDEPTFVMPWHMHDLFEMTLVLAGAGTRIIGDNIDSFFPGDLLLLGPGLPHVWKDDSQRRSGGRVRSITLQFAPSFPSSTLLALPEMYPMATLLEQAERGVLLHGPLRLRVAHKLEELLQIEGMRRVLLVLEILSDIAESSQHAPLASNGYTCARGIDAERWNKLNTHILENFRHPITAADLADIARMHPSSLGRYFKRTAGLCVTDYINQVRIGHACRLLSSTQDPVVQICYESGFQNLSFFNRVFKAVKGITPSAYRSAIQRAARGRADE